MERVAQFVTGCCQICFAVCYQAIVRMSGLCEVVALRRNESSSASASLNASANASGAGLRKSHRQACEHVRKSRVSTFAPTASIVLPFRVSRVEKIRFLQIFSSSLRTCKL
ncbi:uncharacterized protein LOC105202357 [Solenopsis invicta]|uniref:uncharacterized protein LOC105202357 n=1 Tax=Solenopsis invicta TaxID=13686 RepID=UPI00193D941C|nr:uncharacterized protein LOC105202357 [Solenopsis invicta]XP_039305994.1 uncharacterized protein LOC105202357 [Solenopsis invicta]